MGALLIATIKIVGIGALIIAGICATAVFSWGFVYHLRGCRRKPIQKAALMTIAILWAVGAFIINIL